MAEIRYKSVLIKMSFPPKLSVIRAPSTLACELISDFHGNRCAWIFICRLLSRFGVCPQTAVIPKVLFMQNSDCPIFWLSNPFSPQSPCLSSELLLL